LPTSLGNFTGVNTSWIVLTQVDLHKLVSNLKSQQAAVWSA